MTQFKLLDCTLRDGGYITNWEFEDSTIKAIISQLIEANLDFVEVGYLNNQKSTPNSTQYNSIEKIRSFLPTNHIKCGILAMADVEQYSVSDITPHDGNSIDGIRVVFYKHQIESAFTFAQAVKEQGYKLFLQPMVTVDYSLEEYIQLVKRFAALNPYALSIVDSFGCMTPAKFRLYMNVLDNELDPKICVGIHTHDNMHFAFSVAQEVMNYSTSRPIIMDASLYGMGRGAGNLCTEVIANYYNNCLYQKYDISTLLGLISDYIMPIRKGMEWGPSPYMFLTGLYQCHPNFACYLLESHDVSVQDFERFVQTIPAEMLTKCRRPYVEELYQQYRSNTK